MQRSHAILILVAVASLCFLPAVILGSGGIDLIYHLLWSKAFSAQFWQGNWYPRLLMDLNAGCGYPVFYYYPPVAYYLTIPFYFLSQIPQAGWLPMVAQGWLVSLLGAWFCWLWIHEVTKSHVAALVAALLFIVLPYRILEFHSLMMYSAFTAFIWVPLLLYFSLRIASRRRFGIVGYAVAYALLLMSNIPDVILFSGLPLLYGVYHAERGHYCRVALHLLLAVTLGFALAAVYLLPMWMGLQDAAIGHADLMQKGILYYGNEFLFDVRRKTLAGHFELRIILSGVTFLMAVLGYTFWKRLKKVNGSGPYQSETRFWLVISVITIFMMVPLSKPLWDALSILQVVQFPWRLSNALVLAFIAMAAAVISAERKMLRELWYPALMLIFLLLPFVVSFVLGSRQDFMPLKAGQEPKTYNEAILRYYQYDTPWSEEYLSIKVPGKWFKYDALPSLAKLCSQKIKLVSGKGKVKLSGWKPGEIAFDIEAKSPAVVELGQFYYSRWDAGSYPVNAAKSGLMRVQVPEGERHVVLRLKESRAEQAGKLISLVALCCVVIAGLCLWRKR